MRNKERNNLLMQIANDALIKSKNNKNSLFKSGTNDIVSSYNGQISGFSVSIAITGLLPTLAMYYQDGKNAVCLRNILDVIGLMLPELDASTYNGITCSKSLFEFAINSKGEKQEKLKRDIIDCAIALKQIVRTYQLV